jgi:hypothetical protein
VRLDPETVMALAAEIADRLETRRVEPEPWVAAGVVAAHLSTTTDYIYKHAAELGGVKLGEGSKGRLRFKLSTVDAALSRLGGGGSAEAPERTAKRKPPRRRRRPLGTTGDLLPIRGGG